VKIKFLSAVWFVTSCGGAFASVLPAFPGAEGYGAIATGGRGGDVYYVTNLNASGPGSLVEGVNTSPPEGRTILFAVSGHIRLSSTLTVRNNKITIAGQTAPGDGICFWNKPTNFTGSDLVVRNIRFRYGKQTAGGDAVNIGAAQRIIFDHCDVMFSTDENMSSFGAAPEHMTFQWSTNAWGLSGHSAGGLWKVKHATVHHTLWANNHTRNPKLIGGEVFDWVNNLTFGWNNGFNMAEDVTGGLGIAHRVNIRNSSFVHGGSTTTAIYGGALNDDGSTKFKLHMADSALDGNNNGILDVSRAGYQMVSSTGYSQTPAAWPQTHLGDPANPVIGIPVTTTPRLTGYKKIMSKTGAVRMETGARPLRDEITQLCVTRAANLQRGIISDPLELNLSTGTAFASLQSTPAPIDADLDGMPDDFEDAVGYDKTVADNNIILTAGETMASFFPPGSPTGYTRLEEYLHFKAVPHGTIGKNTAASPSFIDIDLRKYTSGFNVLPVFTLSNISGGTTTQSGPGGALVRFTPPLDTSGRAGFLFTVTDSAGDTWTQQCCLLISTRPQPRPVSWIGDGTTNNWDSATANFSSNLGPTAFADGDAVTINDSGSNSPTIIVTGALAPASLTVANSTKNFTLQGSGSLSATGRFIKSGTGTLTISNSGPNTFTAATLEGGTLSLTTANALGSAPITFNAGTLAFSADQANALVIGGSVAANPSGSRTMNGAWSGSGTINLTNTGSNLLTLGGSMANFSGDLSFGASTGNVRLYGNAGSASAAFDLGASTATLFTRNGGTSFNLGSLTGASGTTLSGASSTTTLTTYTIGALDTSTTFHGRITNGGQGATALTKTGSGTLTLTGNSTHSGATNINQGSLELLGNFGSSPVNVAADATLTGAGTMGGTLATTAGGIISPGAGEGAAAGTLTAASLNLDSPTLVFDLSSDPATGNDRIVVSNNGAVTLAGTIHFSFHLTDDFLSPGTYELITTTGLVTASGAALASNLPTGTRQTLTLEAHAGGVRLVVSGNQGNLTWTGANGALWDRQTTASWSGASPATFFNFDKVSFTDSATNGSLTITQPVAPQSITVNNTAARPYTFTGAPITGTAPRSSNPAPAPSR
jgi:autotransporter-associated beta strand protein